MPLGAWISTCAPGVNGGNAAPARSTSSKPRIPSARSLACCTRSGSTRSGFSASVIGLVCARKRSRHVLRGSDLERFHRLGREQVLGCEQALRQAAFVVIAEERFERCAVCGETVGPVILANPRTCLLDMRGAT